MSSKAVSMNRVYDIFAQETRKQARLYGQLSGKALLRQGKSTARELPAGKQMSRKVTKK